MHAGSFGMGVHCPQKPSLAMCLLPMAHMSQCRPCTRTQAESLQVMLQQQEQGKERISISGHRAYPIVVFRFQRIT